MYNFFSSRLSKGSSSSWRECLHTMCPKMRKNTYTFRFTVNKALHTTGHFFFLFVPFNQSWKVWWNISQHRAEKFHKKLADREYGFAKHSTFWYNCVLGGIKKLRALFDFLSFTTIHPLNVPSFALTRNKIIIISNFLMNQIKEHFS